MKEMNTIEKMRTKKEMMENYNNEIRNMPAVETMLVGRLALICEILFDIRDLLANQQSK